VIDCFVIYDFYNSRFLLIGLSSVGCNTSKIIKKLFLCPMAFFLTTYAKCLKITFICFYSLIFALLQMEVDTYSRSG
jgi:hypothetical protein